MLRPTRPSARTLVILVPLALAAVTIPSVAAAEVGGSGHTFNACVDQTNFVVFSVIDDDPQCDAIQQLINADPSDPSNASLVLTKVSWNEKGQTGAIGATGPAGANGVVGTTGVSGYTTVTKSVTVAKHKTSTLSLSCPTGKKVTGGGVQPSADTVQVLASYPSAGNAGWAARVSNTGGSGHSVKTYAICAKA